MYPALSDFCPKCQIATGSFFHCLWSCSLILQFWNTIIQQLTLIFKRHLHLGPRTCLLGLNDELSADLHDRDLLHILLHCTRKYILVLWISDKAPSLNQWLKIVSNIIPFEASSIALKDRPLLFFRTWDPYFDYLGFNASQRMRSGLTDLAWVGDTGLLSST